MGPSILHLYFLFKSTASRGHTTSAANYGVYRNKIAQRQAKAWLSHWFAMHNYGLC